MFLVCKTMLEMEHMVAASCVVKMANIDYGGTMGRFVATHGASWQHECAILGFPQTCIRPATPHHGDGRAGPAEHGVASRIFRVWTASTLGITFVLSKLAAPPKNRERYETRSMHRQRRWMTVCVSWLALAFAGIECLKLFPTMEQGLGIEKPGDVFVTIRIENGMASLHDVHATRGSCSPRCRRWSTGRTRCLSTSS